MKAMRTFRRRSAPVVVEPVDYGKLAEERLAAAKTMAEEIASWPPVPEVFIALLEGRALPVAEPMVGNPIRDAEIARMASLMLSSAGFTQINGGIAYRPRKWRG
jgi:hypothetical protein